MRISVLERPATSPEAGAPLVLLHGLMAEAETFRHLVAELPADRRVLVLDLPGAGYSDRDLTANIGFAGMAAIVADVIAMFGVDRPVLLGHSHGAALSLQLATLQPALLSGLVLLCPVHPFSRHEDRLVNFYISRPGRALAKIIPRLPRWFYFLAFLSMPGIRGHFQLDEIEPYRHTLRVPGTVAHLTRVLERWHDDKAQLARDLEAAPIGLPVLMLLGELDAVVPADSAEALRTHLPDVETVTLPGVGHLPSEEVPEECGRLIRAWLGELADRHDADAARSTAAASQTQR